MQSNDSIKKVFLISFLLCAVCSVIVSVAAVKLKPLQVANKELDIKKNLLVSAGLISGDASRAEILDTYKNINTLKATTSKGERTVYIAKDESGEISHYIFPVEGKGLWSTMYGFIALSNDFKTVLGMGFYDHGETPGLGGEITNPNWLESFKGKVSYSADYMPMLEVIKGQVDMSNPASESQIDGLSGATLTTVGVDKLLKFWLSDEGYLPFVKKHTMAEGEL